MTADEKAEPPQLYIETAEGVSPVPPQSQWPGLHGLHRDQGEPEKSLFLEMPEPPPFHLVTEKSDSVQILADLTEEPPGVTFKGRASVPSSDEPSKDGPVNKFSAFEESRGKVENPAEYLAEKLRAYDVRYNTEVSRIGQPKLGMHETPLVSFKFSMLLPDGDIMTGEVQAPCGHAGGTIHGERKNLQLLANLTGELMLAVQHELDMRLTLAEVKSDAEKPCTR